MKTIYYVDANFDDETGRWSAVSTDVPGLVCEAESFKALKAVVADLTPELMELNKHADPGPYHINISVQSPVLVQDETVAAE